MSMLAVMLLAATSARIDSVYLTTSNEKLTVRVAMTGTPGMVAVHREAGAARVTIMDSVLGGQFAGGRRFSWTPRDEFDLALLAATPTKLDRIEIAASDAEVSVLLYVPPEAAVDVKRDARGLLLVLGSGAQAEAPPRTTQAAPPPPPAAPAPEPKREPVATAPIAPTPAPPLAPVTQAQPAVAASTVTVAAATTAPAPTPTASTTAAAPPPADSVDLAKRLFPAATSETKPGASVSELYPLLFPAGVPQAAQPEAAAISDVPEPDEDAGAVLGPFRVRASVEARYVDADTFVETTAQPTRDKYLEVQPRVQAAAPVGAGAFTLEYSPVFRAFATYDQVNTSSHLLGGMLELPVGSRVTLRARDSFQSGVLDTRIVDPGGEYFFGLGRFHRNDVDAEASIVVGPRLNVELRGALGTVRFVEDSSFFDFDTRLVSAGFGFELTPTLRATASYAYDRVPRPEERPEAESTAHSARLALSGEILPLLTGELSVGYRSSDVPNAGPGGQGYSGLVLSAALQREFARELKLSIFGIRSTPVSAFEDDGFYVSTGVQGVIEVPLAARFVARGGLGYQWNDYATIAEQLGVPREDRILSWFAGLRRPIARQLSLSAAYRNERRYSNLDQFETDADGLYLQLEWGIFGKTNR